QLPQRSCPQDGRARRAGNHPARMSQAAGARPGRAAALTPASDAASTVAPPTVSDFALHVPWLTGHPSLLCVRLVPELRPSSYLASGQGKLRKLNPPAAGHPLRDGAELSVT